MHFIHIFLSVKFECKKEVKTMKCIKVTVCSHLSLYLKLDILVDTFITYETHTCCLSLALGREFQGCECKMKVGH